MSLAGRTVVITRAEAQSAGLRDALVVRGARVVPVPVLAIEPPVDGGAALAAAARDAAAHDWVVITSPNGADAFADALAGAPCTTPVAVVGRATATRATARGLHVALVPDRFVAEGLVEAFPAAPPEGGRVLVAQAEAARDVVVRGLEGKGWAVTAVVAYRSVAATVAPEALAAARAADAIAFTSGSTVEHYLAAAGADALPPVVACIGPVTADVARAHGVRVDVVADPHTIDGLVDALDAHLAGRAPGDAPTTAP